MLLGVLAPVLVAVPVPVPLGVCEGLCEGVALADRDTLGVTEGDWPVDSEGVGEAESVLLALTVELGVLAPVPVPEAVGEPVDEEVGVAGGVTLLDWLMEAVLEGDEPLVSDGVKEAESVLLALTVLLGVTALVPVPEVVGLPVLVGVGVAGGVALLL